MSYHDRMHSDTPTPKDWRRPEPSARLTSGWPAPDMTNYTVLQFQQRLDAINEKIGSARETFRKRVGGFNARMEELNGWREDTEGMLEELLLGMDVDERAQVEYSWRQD